MKSKIIVLLACLIAVLWVFPGKATACSCIQLTPCEAFGSSAAVFIGRMIEGTEKVSEHTKDGKTILYEAGAVRFAVEEAFKGVNATEITINVMNLRGTSCEGTSVGRGERYLVYADNLERMGLSTGPCSPTKPLAGADEDLKFLRALPQPGTGGRLYGRIGVEKGERNPASLAGVTIIVEDETGQRIETKTNKNSEYEITGLKPGKYTARPVLPEHYAFSNEYQESREVEISDRGCSQASFWVQINGRITGRVTDASGRAAPADLCLVSAKESNKKFLGYTDEDGEYEIDGIPPGRYLLYVEMKAGDKEEPYFHPGVTNRTEATVIEIGMGEKLSKYDFHLPPKLHVKIIQGIVQYSDGRPVVNAEVRLAPERGKTRAYMANDLYTETTTDAQGRFTLHGYEGVSYRVIIFEDLLTLINEKRRATEPERAKLKLEDDITNFKVVIPLEKLSDPPAPQKQKPVPPGPKKKR